MIHGPDLLPLRPKVLRLWVEHFETLTGPETVIVRQIDSAEACEVYRIKAFVPDESCALYTPAALRLASRRI